MYILSCACPSPGIEPRMPTCWAGRRGRTRRSSPTGPRESSAGCHTLGFFTGAGGGRGGRDEADQVAGRATASSGPRIGGSGFASLTIAPARGRAQGVVSLGMPPRSNEVIELLGRVPAFSTLEYSDLQRIAKVAVPRRFEAGQAVFREGDASDTCYVVRLGRARAVRSHNDGRTITLATFGPGDIFGELAMFEDERRSATVEAIDAVSVVGVLGPDMRRLMREHPEISIPPGDLARPPPARDQRAPLPPVLSDRAEPCRGRAQRARRAGASPAARTPPRCWSRPRRPNWRAAGGVLARVRQPFPGGPGAGRRDLAGPRAPGRPDPAALKQYDF